VPRSPDGCIDYLWSRFRHTGNERTIRGIDIIELAITGDELAIYEVAEQLRYAGMARRHCPSPRH
jgi:hypothetical protein